MADTPRTTQTSRGWASHTRDSVSLVLGLLLLAVAGLFLYADLSHESLDLRWIGPLVLIGVGTAGLATSTRRSD